MTLASRCSRCRFSSTAGTSRLRCIRSPICRLRISSRLRSSAIWAFSSRRISWRTSRSRSSMACRRGCLSVTSRARLLRSRMRSVWVEVRRWTAGFCVSMYTRSVALTRVGPLEPGPHLVELDALLPGLLDVPAHLGEQRQEHRGLGARRDDAIGVAERPHLLLGPAHAPLDLLQLGLDELARLDDARVAVGLVVVAVRLGHGVGDVAGLRRIGRGGGDLEDAGAGDPVDLDLVRPGSPACWCRRVTHAALRRRWSGAGGRAGAATSSRIG